MINLTRRGIDIYFDASSEREQRVIESALQEKVDGAHFSKLYRQGHWDGIFRLYEARHNSFKYGLLAEIEKLLQSKQIEYKIHNNFKPVKLDIAKIDGTLWQHQREAIVEYFKLPYGTIKIPTRGGKTRFLGEIIKLTKPTCTLFIVDNQVLFLQAIDDLSDWLGIAKEEIGVIKDGEFHPNEHGVTVAMIQSMQSLRFGFSRLNKNKERKAKKTDEELKQLRKHLRANVRALGLYLKKVKFLAVDEVHEFSSDQRYDICCDVDCADMYIFLSATPDKSENPLANRKLKRLRGEIVFDIVAKTLRERKVLAEEKILLLYIDHELDNNIPLTDVSDYAEFEHEVIVNNERRNSIVLNVLQILDKLNLKTLALFNKISHAKYIQNITGNELITSEDKINRRIIAIQEFLTGMGGCLLATNILNKGVTLPEAQVCFIIGGGLEQSRTVQQKGRTGGRTATKTKSLIIDFVDNSKYFRDHSLNRIEAYVENVGKENMFVYDVHDPEFYQDIREFLSVWKRG